MLCLASHYNDLPWLNMLLEAGADANGCDYDKRTPLHIAAADGHLKAVRVLVEQGKAKVNVHDRWGNSPLSEAKKINASNVVDYLVSINRGDGSPSRSKE
jgi:glutaminase